MKEIIILVLVFYSIISTCFVSGQSENIERLQKVLHEKSDEIWKLKHEQK